MVTASVVCQKIFFACTPPLKVIMTFELTVRVPPTWNIKMSVELPLMVTFVGIVTALVHLYSPAVSVLPPIFPAPRFKKSGLRRPAASLYAVLISATAVVNLEASCTSHGGPFPSTVYIVPVTSEQVKRRAVPAIGLVPTLPVTAD